MNIMDFIILGVIVFAVISIIFYKCKHNGGCGDCHGCELDCHKPSIYEAYRKDHPHITE